MFTVERYCWIYQATDAQFYLDLEEVGGPDENGQFYGTEHIEHFGPFLSADLAEIFLRACFPWPGSVATLPAFTQEPPQFLTALPQRVWSR